jgi:hypothetical protein
MQMSDLFPKLAAGRRDGAVAEERGIVRAPVRQNRPPPDFGYSMGHFVSFLDQERLEELAGLLDLPVSSLTKFGIGYGPGSEHERFWAIPEVNCQGTAIGILRRYADGRKLAIAGSQRGLIVPAGWADRPGPVFIPEGFSDTAALTFRGHAAIGRPSARGGVELLAEFFGDVQRDVIIILGENDQKPDGSWPGRDGAIDVARQLTRRLGREVRYSLPPTGFKDVRDFVIGRRISNVHRGND